MDQELMARLDAQDKKLDEVYRSAEKTRKYILVMMWIGVITVLLPLLGLFFAIPWFINSYLGALNGLM